MIKRVTRTYQSAAEFATSEIRRLILNGELLQGERIEQEQIAERLGMSRLPIRQALERLSEQGFIEMAPNRGAVVSELSLEDMTELYLARQRLEEWALRDAWGAYTPELLAKLRRHIEDAAAAIERQSLDDFMVANRDFHLDMYAPAGNKYLQNMITKLFDLSERYQRTSLQQPGRMQTSHDHHLELFAALEKNELNAFLDLAKKHNLATQYSVQQKVGGPSGI